MLATERFKRVAPERVKAINSFICDFIENRTSWSLKQWKNDRMNQKRS